MTMRRKRPTLMTLLLLAPCNEAFTVTQQQLFRHLPILPAGQSKRGSMHLTKNTSTKQSVRFLPPTPRCGISSSSRLSMIFNSQRGLTKLFNYDEKDPEAKKRRLDYGTTEAFGTDYMPLEITCDPNYYHPDCGIDGDVPGYTGFDRDQFLNLFIPSIAPILAFMSFEFVGEMYDAFIGLFNIGKTWVAVDGGAFQARIMTPAINGLVVPAITLLFATLTSTTITTLRQRQVDVRNAINMEAGELRALECSVESFGFCTYEQDLCRDYLIQYTSRILAECHPRMGSGENVINPRRGMDSELNGLTALLNKSYGTPAIPAHIADECYSSIARLREQRTFRISALQSVYPFLHYVILVVLALGECFSFLMETDQDFLVFLNAIQIKILWSMMVGTFVACFTVIMDLRSPFAGAYQISASVGQLHTIKLTLQASKQMNYNQELRMKKEEKDKQQQFLAFNGANSLPNTINNKNESNDSSSLSIDRKGEIGKNHLIVSDMSNTVENDVNLSGSFNMDCENNANKAKVSFRSDFEDKFHADGVGSDVAKLVECDDITPSKTSIDLYHENSSNGRTDQNSIKKQTAQIVGSNLSLSGLKASLFTEFTSKDFVTQAVGNDEISTYDIKRIHTSGNSSPTSASDASTASSPKVVDSLTDSVEAIRLSK